MAFSSISRADSPVHNIRIDASGRPDSTSPVMDIPQAPRAHVCNLPIFLRSSFLEAQGVAPSEGSNRSSPFSSLERRVSVWQDNGLFVMEEEQELSPQTPVPRRVSLVATMVLQQRELTEESKEAEPPVQVTTFLPQSFEVYTMHPALNQEMEAPFFLPSPDDGVVFEQEDFLLPVQEQPMVIKKSQTSRKGLNLLV